MVLKFRCWPAGAHVRITLFVAKEEDQTFANCGDLTMRGPEADVFLSSFVDVEALKAGPDHSERREIYPADGEPFVVIAELHEGQGW